MALDVHNMGPAEQSALKDFEEAYKQASMTWHPFWSNARRDHSFFLGKQWTNKQKTYLQNQRRKAMVYNRCLRLVSIISGYERRNRLSLKVGPYGIEDDMIAEQMTGLLMHAMTFSNGYYTVSECFQKGPLVTGLGWIEPYLDPISRLLKYKRRPYSHIAVDPAMSEIDMSDCGFAIAREILTKDQIKQIIPDEGGIHGFIDSLEAGGWDEKFDKMPYARKRINDEMMSYDRFFERKNKEITMLVNRQTGQKTPWRKSKAELKELMQAGAEAEFVEIKDHEPGMNLRMMVQNRLVWEGPDPLHIGTYPLIPFFGYFHPECEEDGLRLQGVVRALRDPQSNYNQRMSQMHDIVESSISTGWIAETGAVVDKKMLYQSGQAPVIWANKGKIGAIEKITPPIIPEGFFALADRDAQNMDQIPGVNEELFGTDDKDIPGILSKLRQGGALTTLQTLFDNLRESKKRVGLVSCKIFQMNYDAEMIQRITNKPVEDAFYATDLMSYDCIPTEGIHTDTQRQMFYAELKELQASGAPIPWSQIIKYSPVQFKKELAESIQMAEQQQQAQAQLAAQQEQLLQGLQKAQIAADLGRAEERRTQARENETGAALDRVKTAAEINKLQNENRQSLIEMAQTLEPKGRKPDNGKGKSKVSRR